MSEHRQHNLDSEDAELLDLLLFALDDEELVSDEVGGEDAAILRMVMEAAQAEVEVPQNDLRDHRIINAVLEETRPKQQTQWHYWAAAAAVAGLVLGGLAFWSAQTQEPVAPPVVAAAPLELRPLLNEPEDKLQVAHAVTAYSDTAFSIGEDVGILLEKDSVATVMHADTDGIEIRVLKGAILANVTPNKNVNLLVHSGDSTVKVTGTVFAVRAGKNADVKVLRGSVKVQRASAKTHAVKGGESLVFENEKVSTFDPATEWKAWTYHEVLERRGEKEQAWLDVQGTPGATIKVDGKVLGTSPMRVTVAPGKHSVSAHKDGMESKSQDVSALVDRHSRVVFALQSKKAPTSIDTTAKATEAPSSRELLNRALAFRKKKQWSKAAAAYNDLIRQHPRSGEAKTSLISLADLELDRLKRPSKALQHYSRYLRSGGGLSQEATYGQIRAYRRLGDKNNEKRTIERFLKKYPTAVQAQALRSRLKEL